MARQEPQTLVQAAAVAAVKAAMLAETAVREL
jgi:hypothetical protein